MQNPDNQQGICNIQNDNEENDNQPQDTPSDEDDSGEDFDGDKNIPDDNTTQNNGNGSDNNTSSGGDSSNTIGDKLDAQGFSQVMSNVYIYQENDTYYGEIVTQPNVTIIYIKKEAIILTLRCKMY